MDGSHSAKIGELKLARWESFGPAFIVSSDTSGFVACWSLGSLVDELSFISCHKEDTSNIHSSHRSKQTPIWYVIQGSHGQPICDFFGDTVLVCGSQGMKIYDLFTGNSLGSLLTDVIGGIYSLFVSFTTGIAYCGTSSGILYTTYLSPLKVSR